MVKYLSSIGKMPEMIVVGIANTNRVRDLTPTHSIYWSNGEQDSSVLGSSGGGEKFIDFIEHELIPYIDTAYAATPYRMLVGHSLGGLTVLQSLLYHPALFSSYVAIDPSVWWDNQALMKNISKQLLSKDYNHKSLFYASANAMNKGMEISRVLQDTAYGNIHVRNNLQFQRILQKSQKSSLQWNWKFYEEDNHVSVPLMAGYDALRFLFKGYELDKALNDTSITVDYIIKHFQKQSLMLQYKVLPSESIVNSLGYIFLQRKNYVRAFQFFALNLENFPSSANVFDSMGDYYLEIMDRRKASELFRKSLQLKEMPDTRKKLLSLDGN
jgi:predicted alpha/beta superfamily hydrolase